MAQRVPRRKTLPNSPMMPGASLFHPAARVEACRMGNAGLRLPVERG